ncbi:hypothetical protein BJ322DRAFT_1220456 [Thelephora terrestris]|uniref:Uncharacterized protein n=1 Tax=Thelephora terrestris TaxID=56493 RepID=A0A9P6L4C9_9AGAM|nr:hypothetical protein BJ322DRAFT_1220456 [Thelephora terrestris]
MANEVRNQSTGIKGILKFLSVGGPSSFGRILVKFTPECPRRYVEVSRLEPGQTQNHPVVVFVPLDSDLRQTANLAYQRECLSPRDRRTYAAVWTVESCIAVVEWIDSWQLTRERQVPCSGIVVACQVSSPLDSSKSLGIHTGIFVRGCVRTFMKLVDWAPREFESAWEAGVLVISVHCFVDPVPSPLGSSVPRDGPLSQSLLSHKLYSQQLILIQLLTNASLEQKLFLSDPDQIMRFWSSNPFLHPGLVTKFLSRPQRRYFGNTGSPALYEKSSPLSQIRLRDVVTAVVESAPADNFALIFGRASDEPPNSCYHSYRSAFISRTPKDTHRSASLLSSGFPGLAFYYVASVPPLKDFRAKANVTFKTRGYSFQAGLAIQQRQRERWRQHLQPTITAGYNNYNNPQTLPQGLMRITSKQITVSAIRALGSTDFPAIGSILGTNTAPNQINVTQTQNSATGYAAQVGGVIATDSGDAWGATTGPAVEYLLAMAREGRRPINFPVVNSNTTTFSIIQVSTLAGSTTGITDLGYRRRLFSDFCAKRSSYYKSNSNQEQQQQQKYRRKHGNNGKCNNCTKNNGFTYMNVSEHLSHGSVGNINASSSCSCRVFDGNCEHVREATDYIFQLADIPAAAIRRANGAARAGARVCNGTHIRIPSLIAFVFVEPTNLPNRPNTVLNAYLIKRERKIAYSCICPMVRPSMTVAVLEGLWIHSAVPRFSVPRYFLQDVGLSRSNAVANWLLLVYETKAYPIDNPPCLTKKAASSVFPAFFLTLHFDFQGMIMMIVRYKMVNNLLFTEPLLQQVKTPERHHDRRGGNPTSGKITLPRDDERQIQAAILLFMVRRWNLYAMRLVKHTALGQKPPETCLGDTNITCRTVPHPLFLGPLLRGMMIVKLNYKLLYSVLYLHAIDNNFQSRCALLVGVPWDPENLTLPEGEPGRPSLTLGYSQVISVSRLAPGFSLSLRLGWNTLRLLMQCQNLGGGIHILTVKQRKPDDSFAPP